MNAKKTFFILAVLLLALPVAVLAQVPPPPPPPINVPIDLGSGILLAVAASFGAWKIYNHKRKSQEA